jgi:hypothetical protein
MDGGYFLFSLVDHPEKYLGFNRNGKPINYEKPKIDKQCRKIFKRITEDSSNGLSTSTIDYEATTALANSNANNVNHRHKSSTRSHQRTHSNRIETSKSRSTSPLTSSKRRKLQSQKNSQPPQHNSNSQPPQHNSNSQPPHHVRHHHDQPLRHYHTISHKDNKNIDSNSSTKQLGNEDLNAIYNHNDSGVNIESENKANRHVKKPHKGDIDSRNPTNDNLGNDENNNDTNNCTYNTADETDDKGKKIAKGRNAAHANDKPNNKCNNNNRRNRKNNENGRHSRRPSQKSSSLKHQQAKEV